MRLNKTFLSKLECFVFDFHYLCIMKVKEEIGKWLMDVAKYVATAVLISTFLGEFSSRWVVYLLGGLTVIIFLGMSLWFIDKTNQEKKGD